MYAHDGINDEIQFLAKSEIRLKILNELNDQPDNVRGLVKKTKITYSSVSSNITKLEQNNYIRKINKQYHINPLAKIYLKTLMDFKKSVDIVNDYNTLWFKHNINQLSLESMRSITYLKNSELVETTPIDIYKTHNTIKQQLVESKNVKAIFPYLHPEYPKIIGKILKNNGSVELIIPKSIHKAILTPIDVQLKKRALKKGKLKIYSVTTDLNLYLTICDEEMSLGLFKNDGSFDQNRILISNDKKSHEWADELFKHIKHEVIK